VARILADKDIRRLIGSSTLSQKIDETRKNVLEKFESLFDQKFLRVVGVILGGLPIMYGGVTYLQGTTLGGRPVAFIAMKAGVMILLISYFLSRKPA
jgi:hypothetical protein